jgi:hypothetical protein
MTKNEVFFQLRTASTALMRVLVADSAEAVDCLDEQAVEELRDALLAIEQAQAAIWPPEVQP